MAQRRVLIQVDVEDGQAETKVSRLTNAFDQLDEHSTRAGGGLRSAFLQADLAARAIQHITQELFDAGKEFLRYNKELANLNTLLEDGRQIDSFREGLVRLDPHLGQTSELTRGMYQAISSGVDAGDALQFIETSAKAARAGVASTFETVDAGSTILASFKLEAKDATMVYDKMFEVVKRGKIEMPQLAQSIGLVANIAAQTGVTLDEMFAVIATASTTIRPAQAIEGFRTLLANILKPSEQALEVARRLGIEFNEDALRSKGFAAFLNDITTAADGNKEVLARLFGDVQALNVVMAVTGNRAETLAKDLKGIAAASGTVEAAFQKQKQSTEAQLTALKVTFQQFLIKSFMLVEPLLTGILTLVNKYPAVFGAAAVALAGLVVAHLAWNTQLFITAGTYIPQLIANVRNLITVMIAFRQVTALSTTGLIAFAAGWAGIVLAIGIVIIALTDYDSAAEAANKLTIEQVENQAKAYDAAKKLADSVREVAAAQEGSADRHEKLNAILAQLDPATRTYIEALKDEKVQVAALNEEIEKRIANEKSVLEAQLRTTSSGILAQLKTIREEQQLIEKAQQRIRDIQPSLKSADPVLRFTTRAEIQELDRIILSADDSLKRLRTELAANEAKLLTTAQALGLNRQQLVQWLQTSGHTAEIAKQLADRFDALTPKIQQTNKALADQVLTIDQVRQALKSLKETGDFEIDTKILDIVKKAKSAAEARKLAQDALKGDETFRNLVEQRKLYNAAEKAAREVFDPSLKQGRDRGDAVKSTTDEVRKLRAEVEALQRNGGVLYKLKIEKSDLEQTKSDLENILKLRHQLTLPLTTPLPRDLAGIREETRVLNEQKKIVEAVTEAKHAQSTAEFELAQLILTSTIPLVNAESRAQKLYVQAVRERKNAELDLTAQLNTAVRLRREALEAEQSTLRDTRQQYTQLRLEAVKAAEDARLADIRSQIEFAVAFGEEPELQQRLQIELNKETDQIKPPIVEINSNVKTIVERLTGILGALSGNSGGTTSAGARDFDFTAFVNSIDDPKVLRQGIDLMRGATADVEKEVEALKRGQTAASIGEPPPVPRLVPTPPGELDDVARMAAFGSGVDLVDLNEVTRFRQEYTRQRNAIIDLIKAEQELKNAREIDAALRRKLFHETGKALEQLSIESALKNRERERIKEDVAAATAAGVVQHDLASQAANDAEYQITLQRQLREACDTRAAAELADIKNIAVSQDYLNKLRTQEVNTVRQLNRSFQSERLAEETRVATEIKRTEDAIAHAGEGAADRYRLAWLKSIREVVEADQAAAESRIRSSVKIQDATVFHAEQANATVLEFLASQKTVTELVAGSKIEAIKEGFGAIDRAFQRLVGTGNAFKRMLADVLANLTKLALTKFIAPLFGGGGQGISGGNGNLFGAMLNFLRPAAGGSGGGGGGQFLGLTGAGVTGPAAAQANALSNIFKVANPFSAFTGSTLTPPVSLTAQQNNTAQLQQLVSQAPGSVATGAFAAGGGGFSLAGMAKGFAPLAPLLGITLGASLGGSSRLGSILGAAGGGIAGLGAAALLGSSAAASAFGSISTIGGLLPFALPILPIAGALLIGAIILGKNAARRRDETTRNKQMLDSLGQLDEILRAVKADRMDGGAALGSAAQIRAQYVEAMSALKDKKTREIALKDVSRLDLKIGQIRGEANLQLQRQAIDEKLVPEFASGGFTPGMLSLIKVRPGELFLPPEAQLQLARNGGFIPGPDYGRDNTFMMAPANSLVVPQRKAPSVSVPALAAPSRTSFTSGSSGRPSEQQPSFSIGELVIQASSIEVDQDAGKIVAKGLRMPAGKAAYWREYKGGVDEGRLRS